MDKKENSDGFKFALTAITSLLTFSYVMYNYCQNNPIDKDFHIFVIFLINTAIITSAFFIFYVVVKGFTMEMKDSKLINSLENFASDIYIISFFVYIIILIFMLLLFIAVLLDDFESKIYGRIFLILFLVITYLYAKIIYINHRQKTLLQYPQKIIRTRQKNKLSESISLKFFSVSDKIQQKYPEVFSLVLRIPNQVYYKTFIFYVMLFIVIAYSIFPLITIIIFMQGHIEVDMDSIYYKNDTQIPVLIQVTGPDTGLSIELLKEHSNNLSQMAYIDYLGTQHNIKTSTNNSLVGNTFSNGKYRVFINTTNLPTGYYELKCERPEYGSTYQSFHLLDNK